MRQPNMLGATAHFGKHKIGPNLKPFHFNFEIQYFKISVELKLLQLKYNKEMTSIKATLHSHQIPTGAHTTVVIG